MTGPGLAGNSGNSSFPVSSRCMILPGEVRIEHGPDPPEDGPGKPSVVRRGGTGIGRPAGQHVLDPRPNGVGQHRPVRTHPMTVRLAVATVPAVIATENRTGPTIRNPIVNRPYASVSMASASISTR